jgi:hypothetical protein
LIAPSMTQGEAVEALRGGPRSNENTGPSPGQIRSGADPELSGRAWETKLRAALLPGRLRARTASPTKRGDTPYW